MLGLCDLPARGAKCNPQRWILIYELCSRISVRVKVSEIGALRSPRTRSTV